MVHFNLPLALSFLVGVLALPNPNPLAADPSGEKNVGNGQGQQFITGGCLSDADCQSACCATFSGGGICSAKAAANEQGKQGCGFNGSGEQAAISSDAAVQVTSTPAAQAPAGTRAVNSDEAGAENVGTGNGKQFITGQCLSGADCASGCCAGSSGSANGACSAVAVANANGKTGCGFTQA
ncbi:biotrophy-associated secreted 2 [Fusarium albosuccineum]|uniref:Biotrophy-associated secreted 2 n=1 Tax=Fusarium albosuccineum TaxID=1237068 RepID=A0A8H4P855_9HYPO|nr:biotrophy-associated secreted 2 [Fusarium albosuccineum]